MMNLLHDFKRVIFKNKVASFIIVTTIVLQHILDVLGKFVDLFHKL